MTPLLVFAVLAQSDAPPRNVVLADLGLHVIGAGYQRTVGEHIALQVDLESYTPWTQNINLGGLSGEASRGDVSGVLVRVRPFFFLTAEAPRGLWVSPFMQGGPAWQSAGEKRVSGSAWSTGLSVGWAWLPFDRLHIVFGLGGQYHSTLFTEGPRFARFYPTLDATVGWAF